MSFINSDASKPIFKQIEDRIKHNISTGIWNEGYKLPSEEEFSRELKVSRGTVRKAIKELVKAGYIEQVHGKGTFVLGRFTTSSLAQEFISTAESLISSGVEYETEVLVKEVIKPSKRIMSKLECDSDTPILYLKRIRIVDNEKVILMENWVNMRICDGIEHEDFKTNTVFDMMEKVTNKNIKFGIRSFEAKSVDDEQARILDVATSSPILFLEQSTFMEEDQVAEYANIWIKSDKHKIISVLER